MKTNIRRSASSAAIIAGLAGALPVWAQETPAPAPQVDQIAPQTAPDEQGRDRVIVTGSRVATGADAPTPVTSVTTEVINQVELPNIADALQQLPALSSTVTPSQGGQGDTIGSALNLRGFGVRRTLTLVDGKRFVPTAQLVSRRDFSVNVDSIPQGLIERVDVVTGGASAAYGSDAISGVVNFILDKDFEGISGEVNYGVTSRDDGRRYGIQLNAGGGFDDDRGHIIASLEYSKDEGIPGDELGLNPRRDWQDLAHTRGYEVVDDEVRLVPNATFWKHPLNGFVIGCEGGGFFAYFFDCPVGVGGLDADGRGLSFTNDGTATQPYNLGIIDDPNFETLFANGGDGYTVGPQAALASPSTRTLLFTRADYDISDKLNVYLEAEVARGTTYIETGAGAADWIAGVTGQGVGFRIPRSYAFLPDNLAAAMDANGVDAIYVNNWFPFVAKQDFETDTKRIVTGATYDFDGNWQGEIYYTYGETKSQLTLTDLPSGPALFNALTAVRNPDGSITCAVGGPDCVPYNVFGREIPANVRRYINPEVSYHNENTQQVVEATVTGTLFTLPAGDVDVATGAGYRRETLKASTDSLGLSAVENPFNPVALGGALGGLVYLNQPAAEGALEVWEYFGEAQIPVLEDLPFIDSLDVNLAARQTEYSTFGGVTTWKAGAVWSPFEGLRVRTTRSRDIRAANLIEAFSPRATGYAEIRDPRSPSLPRFPITPIEGGNPDLLPEEADTTTIGLVWQPGFLSGFTATADYFEIETEGGITTVSAQRTVNLCFEGQSFFCARVNPGTPNPNPNALPPGNITTVETPFTNGGSSKLRGADVELGYTQDLDIFGLAGTASLRTYVTYIFEDSSIAARFPGEAPATPQDGAAAPGQLQGLITASYEVGDWSFGVVEHFYGPGRYNTSNDPTNPRFVGDRAESWWGTDLSVRRSFGDNVEVYGSVVNVFDKDPGLVYVSTQGYGTNASVGDTQGRRFLVGMRFRS